MSTGEPGPGHCRRRVPHRLCRRRADQHVTVARPPDRRAVAVRFPCRRLPPGTQTALSRVAWLGGLIAIRWHRGTTEGCGRPVHH